MRKRGDIESGRARVLGRGESPTVDVMNEGIVVAHIPVGEVNILEIEKSEAIKT